MPPRSRGGISVAHEDGDEVGELCLDSRCEGVASPSCYYSSCSLTLARNNKFIISSSSSSSIGEVVGGGGGGEDLPCIDESHEIPPQATAPDIRARAGGVVGPDRGFGGVVAVGEEAGGVGGVGVEELDLEEGVVSGGEGGGLGSHKREEGNGAV